jgi:hypothetical protein
MLLGATPRLAAQTIPSCPACRSRAHRREVDGRELPLAVERDRPAGDQAVPVRGRVDVRGIGVDLDPPAVRGARAQEGHGHVVRSPLAVVDLHGVLEVRLDARRAIAGGVLRQVAERVGARVERLVGVQVRAELDRRGRGGDAADAAGVDGRERVDVDHLAVRVEGPALQVVARRRAKVAQEIGGEGSGAGVDLLAAPLAPGVEDEEAGTRDRRVGR